MLCSVCGVVGRGPTHSTEPNTRATEDGALALALRAVPAALCVAPLKRAHGGSAEERGRGWVVVLLRVQPAESEGLNDQLTAACGCAGGCCCAWCCRHANSRDLKGGGGVGLPQAQRDRLFLLATLQQASRRESGAAQVGT